ncbi:MAG: polymerase, sigma-24 subunit, subfamily [Pedosphaera sp.]|nr:polymerase, sigma-24 subunit, subfamily [Pedosphaera sp.]
MTSRLEKRETEVFLLTVKHPNAAGLKLHQEDRPAANGSSFGSGGGSSSRSGPGNYHSANQTLSALAYYLETSLAVPVIDQTELTGNFDIDLKWAASGGQSPNPEAIKQAVLDQLGLELVPSAQPIEMLIIEEAK